MRFFLILLLFPVFLWGQNWYVPNATYSNSTSDDTKAWYDMLRDASVAGVDTLFVSGTWELGGAARMNLQNLVVVLEEGALVRTLTTGDLTGLDGNNCKCWTSVDQLLVHYPNRTGTIINGLNTYRPLSEGYGPFWLGSSTDNLVVIAYGAVVQGNYPERNIGDNPATNDCEPGVTNCPDNTFEKYHGLQIDASTNNISIYGGTWQNFAGDGINIFRTGGVEPVILKDIVCRWNKRLGLSLVDIHGPVYAENIEVYQNGRGPELTDYGTNTRHGITLEPENPASSYADVTFTNVRAVENADSNIGLHLWNMTSEAGIGSTTSMNISFDGLHLEDGSTIADWTPSGAIYVGPTDGFNNDKGANSIWGDDPVPGTISFSNVAIWGDQENGIAGRSYGGTALSFDNTVIYEVDYTGAENSYGDGPISFLPLCCGPSATPTNTLKDIDFGDMVIINAGANDPPVTISNSSSYTTIASTVTGNLTTFDSYAGSTLSVIGYTGATNNSTISESAYPGTAPTVSIAAVDNEAAESDLSTGRWRFTRTGATTYPLAVYYTVGTTGPAVQQHNNIELLRGSVVIPVGSETVDLLLKPIRNNKNADGIRSVTLTIQPRTNLYSGSGSATVYLVDNPGSSPIVPTADLKVNETSGMLISH